MRNTVDSIMKSNRNPFISELSFLDTDDLIWLENNLSGYWLGKVRRELNLRTVSEAKYIAPRVSRVGYNQIFCEF